MNYLKSFTGRKVLFGENFF